MLRWLLWHGRLMRLRQTMLRWRQESMLRRWMRHRMLGRLRWESMLRRLMRKTMRRKLMGMMLVILRNRLVRMQLGRWMLRYLGGRRPKLRELPGPWRLLVQVWVRIGVVDGWIWHVCEAILRGRRRGGMRVLLGDQIRAHAADVVSRGRSRNTLRLGGTMTGAKRDTVGNWW